MARTILLASDGSPAALHAGDVAVEIARCENADLVVLGVLHPRYFGDSTQFGDSAALLTQIRATIDDEVIRLSKAGALATGRVWESADRVEDAVERVADEISPVMIVIGTHGHSWLDRALVGSTTESIMRKTKYPVLAVPPIPVGSGTTTRTREAATV